MRPELLGDDESDVQPFTVRDSADITHEGGTANHNFGGTMAIGHHAVKLNTAVNGIYALRSSIDNGFDSDVRLRHPLRVRITGNIVAARLHVCRLR